MEKTTAVIFLNSEKFETPIENYFFRCLRALALDSATKLKAAAHIKNVFICTRNNSFKKLIGELDNIKIISSAVPPGDKFSFGKALVDLVKKYFLKSIFYLGAGAGVLLEEEEIDWIAKRIVEKKDLIIANNFYSSDFFAFTPAEAVFKVRNLPAEDNPLAYLLKEEAGLKNQRVKPSVGTFLDIDSTIDLVILSKFSKKGRHISKELKREDRLEAKIEEALKMFGDYGAEIFLAGRVGSHIYSHLTKNLKCRFRVFSEECGMKAWGRERSGKVYSYLGRLIEEIGIKTFFKEISCTSSAAFIDSRVIFSHFKERVSRSDRFYSDLGRTEKIKNEFAKRLTHLANESSIPVFLGGHSLLSGGLYVLTEIFKERKSGLAKV